MLKKIGSSTLKTLGKEGKLRARVDNSQSVLLNMLLASANFKNLVED
jgi:hypothetical protein